ncbi:hypothetical protein F5X96DRAFT_688041 [Biscogniauxia mediterranea]|nr:hypothetical protein F5X96DRAFT_688041 [Biscogniauxia mediterranea]
MAYAPQWDHTTDPEEDPYKRAVGEEKLGEAIVNLHTLISEGFPGQRPDKKLQSIFRQEVVKPEPSCLILAALELSSKLIIAARLIRSLRHFLNDFDFPLVANQALDPNRPRLFTDKFAHDLLSHVRRVLRIWGQAEYLIDGAFRYNELFYEIQDGLAFASRASASNEAYERQFRDHFKIRDNVDVGSIAFKDDFRFVILVSTIRAVSGGDRVVSRLRDFTRANDQANWIHCEGVSYLSDRGPYIERSAKLTETFLRLQYARYFDTSADNELWEKRKKAGFPILGDMIYSELYKPHVNYVMDILLDMDRDTRRAFWDVAEDLGISLSFKAHYDNNRSSYGFEDTDEEAEEGEESEYEQGDGVESSDSLSGDSRNHGSGIDVDQGPAPQE